MELCVLVDHVKSWLTQCDLDERRRRIHILTAQLTDVDTATTL